MSYHPIVSFTWQPLTGLPTAVNLAQLVFRPSLALPVLCSALLLNNNRLQILGRGNNLAFAVWRENRGHNSPMRIELLERNPSV